MATSLQLHLDTDFSDTSGNAHTITAHGSAAISSTQSKFGGAAANFPGTTSDYLTVPNSADLQFGSGDFTIEFWLYTSQNTYAMLRKGNEWALTNDASRWVWSVAPGISNIFVASGNVASNTWTHVALVRNGSTTALYVGGTSAASGTSGNITDSTNDITIGVYNSIALNGYMDEIRITKGTAVYTANFTPPTSAFTDPALGATLSGVASTVSTGAVISTPTFALAGGGTTATHGTQIPSFVYSATVNSAALSPGAISTALDNALTGATSTATLGNFQDVLSGIWFDIAGQGFSASGGALTSATNPTLAGGASGLQYGVFGVISESTASLIGESLALTNSQFGVTTAIGATGISATSVIGIPAFVKFAQLSGRQIQAHKGQAVGTLRVGVSGFSVSAAKNTVWPAIGLKSATPVSASAGSVFKSGTIILEGNAVIADAGDAFPRMARPIIGSQVTSSKGGLQYSAGKALLGKSTSPSINPLEFASSDKQSGITGKSITFSAGSLYIGADPWYNFIRVLAVDGAMDSGGSQVVIVLEDIHPDITVIQLA